MREFWILLVQAALMGNILLATGLGLGSFPQGPDKLKTVCREAGAAAWVLVISVSLSRFLDFYGFQFMLPSALRTTVFLLLAYLVLKITAVYGKIKCHEAVLPLALAVTLWVREEEMFPLETAGYALGAALGAGLVLVLGASVMERLDFSPAFRDFRAVPVFFVVLGILSLIFRGFCAII